MKGRLRKIAPENVTEAAGKQVIRQWCLLNMLGLSDEGLTIKELAARFHTTQKTIDRDLKDLQEAGFPLVATRRAHGQNWWRRAAGLIPSIDFSLKEIAALYVSRKLLEPLAGTEIWEGAQEAFQKVSCTFDKKTQKFLDKLTQAFHPTRFGTADYSTYGHMINTLMTAIRNRNIVTLTYQSQSATEPAVRDIHPYHMVHHRGSLYLVAHSPDHDAFRNYKIDRVTIAIIKEERKRDSKREEWHPLPFNPVEFNLEEYLAGSFGIYQGNLPPTKVRIQFAPQVVRYVEEKAWHVTQNRVKQSNGTLILELTLTSFEEVKSWVLSFGPNARVLEPTELIDEIIEDLNNSAQQYAHSTDRSSGGFQPPNQ